MALAAPLELDLGDGRVLHAFKTHCGIMFSMGEIASTIFYENPSAFGKEIRQGKYNKQHTEDKGVLEVLAQFNVLPESSSYSGATLLSPQTLEEILKDKRKFDLVPVLKIALMRMVTQEAASMMGQGKHEDALALALDAIKQGQKIFFPKAPLQLVPLYLLAVQICLCLGRTIQCQELLGIASWLFLQAQASNENYEMHAEISRLFGQLYVLQNNLENALQAFSEEIYYVSLEHGVLDIRTSIGFYNIFKVLKSLGRVEESMAFGDIVVDIWLLTLEGIVLGSSKIKSKVFGDLDPKLDPNLATSHKNIKWIHLQDIIVIIKDILELREQILGSSHNNVGDAFFAIGLIYLYEKDLDQSLKSLNRASIMYIVKNEAMHDLVNKSISLIKDMRVIDDKS